MRSRNAASAFVLILLVGIAACGGEGKVPMEPVGESSQLVPARAARALVLCRVSTQGRTFLTRMPAGDWTGIFNETGTMYRFKVSFLGCVQEGQKMAEVYYPTFPCWGDWTLTRHTSTGWEINEHNISAGCAENVEFALTLDRNTWRISGDSFALDGNPVPPGTYTFDIAHEH